MFRNKNQTIENKNGVHVEVKFLYANKHPSNNDTIEFEKNIDFILSHFPEKDQFPRVISTQKTKDSHVLVFSKEEVLQHFKESDFIDCKINAYPDYTKFKEIQRYPPNFIFIDLDKQDFRSERSFKLALNKTLKNIKERLEGGHPTILETGGGYHIYQPIESTILEEVMDFNEFKEPSQNFLKFAENHLSNHKADPQHHPKFRSCMIRIPGSFNSKRFTKDYEIFQVKIVQKWNGLRPNIKKILGNYYSYLVKQKVDEMRKENRTRNNYSTSIDKIDWIERLLQTPLEEGRKNCLWKILCPYLINVKHLSFDHAYLILKEWLNECNDKRQLDFSPDYKIKTCLKGVGKYLPPNLEKLKQYNLDLYQKLRY